MIPQVTISPSFIASRVKQDGTCAVRLQVNTRGHTAYIPTNIWVKPTQWNKLRKCVVAHPKASAINSHLRSLIVMYEEAVRQLMRDGIVNMSAIKVRDKLIEICFPSEKKSVTLLDVLQTMVENSRTNGSRVLYNSTIKKLTEYGERSNFEDITPKWLNAFDLWLTEHGCPSKNSRSTHFRHIRTAFNTALREELTSAPYPFKVFHIKQEPAETKPYTSHELYTLFNAECSPRERYWLDMLALSFLLIGINMADLSALDIIHNGRIRYKRRKTGRIYSIKVHPLALELINKHRSNTEGRLLDLLDRYKSFDSAGSAYYMYIKAVAVRCGLPPISWYTARYSWATIAANECGMSVDTISLALGHTYGTAVTLGYISPDLSRVDKANEEVIAKVFGKK